MNEHHVRMFYCMRVGKNARRYPLSHQNAIATSDEVIVKNRYRHIRLDVAKCKAINLHSGTGTPKKGEEDIGKVKQHYAMRFFLARDDNAFSDVVRCPKQNSSQQYFVYIFQKLEVTILNIAWPSLHPYISNYTNVP